LFLIDEHYLSEIGGKNKSFKQIKEIPNSNGAMAIAPTLNMTI